jgi:hypothetical protein
MYSAGPRTAPDALLPVPDKPKAAPDAHDSGDRRTEGAEDVLRHLHTDAQLEDRIRHLDDGSGDPSR